MKTNIKIIATSLALTSSFGAWAGIGGLSVQSHLGQPFSGSIVVTGEEAAALQASRNVSVSGSGIRGSVTPQGNGNVVVRLRSSSPIREPIITFTVSAGRQTREYTAMLNPANYTPQPAPQHVEKPTKPTKNKTRQSANTESGERDFIERNTAKRSDVQENTLPVDDNNSTTRKSTKSAHKNNQTAQSNDANDAAVTTKQAQSVQKSGKLAVSPRRYHAKAGETLINIANRYRPRNMSTQTAARALAMANPSVFKRGSTVQHSTTLYIPTPAQWYSYAERAQYHVPANRPTRQTAPRASLPPVDTQPINQAAVENTAPAAPTQPAKPVTPTAQPVTQPTQPAATPPANAKNIASPAQPNAQPVADNQTASATNKNTTTAKTTAASQPANKAAKNTQTVAASGVQAASVVAASRASAPEPITVNADPQAAPEMPVDIPAEEEIDWVVYGAGAVGVAGLLGGLAYYLRRRRTTESEADDDGDVLVVEEKPTKKSKKSKKISLGKKAAAATAVTTASTAAASEFEDEHDFDLDKENDFSKEFEALPDDDDDDGVFFATENVNHSAPNDEFNLDDFKDDFESETSSFNHDSKNQSSDSNNDWYLDDNKNTTNNETEWSLDSHYDNAETHQTTTHDDNAFSAFNDDDDYFAAAPKSQPMADEFDAMLADIDNLEKEATSSSDEDDFDAMFADKLAEIDADLTPSKKTSRNADLDALNSLDDELSAFASKKTKSPAAELDDIDAMFADKLAEIDADLTPSKKTSRNADLDALNSLDDELSAFASKKTKSPAAELDDIDAMFADKLAEIDTDLAPSKKTSRNADLDALNSLDDELSAFASKKTKSPAAELDDIDAMFAGALDSLDSLVEENKASDDLSANELDSLNSLSDFSSFDTDFATTPVQQPTNDDDIDALFADTLSGLDLDTPNHQPHDELVSNAELDSLNSLSDFDQLSAFESAIKPQPTPVNDEMDHLLVDVLSDFEDKPVAAINKPIVSDAEIESLNSLSDLDNLDSGENMDSMFDDALADLDTLNDDMHSSDALSNDELDSLNSLSELDELTFETPAVSTDIVEDEPVLDVDSMAFDLSAFDELEAEHQDESNVLAQPNDSDMAFDLSNFDLPTEAETELTNLSVSDDVDSLDFGVPNHDDLEELGEFSDFELPELADTDSGADIGFVSGTVSGGDTLEGKLDLAKMYIEIGDEDEARRMLRELTEEGDENMAAKAKALLANMS